MKPNRTALIFLPLILALSTLSTCTNPADTFSDAEQLAGLRKVTVTCDSVTYEFGLPAGALGGKSFDSLVKEDSATYTNPANYSITMVVNMTADNTKAGAADAKFDGMKVDAVMDTIVSAPIRTVTGPFTVVKGTRKATPAQGTINLATHRRTGLYIFRQTVDGNPLATTLAPSLDYKVGTLSGIIPLPEIKLNIPTRASDQTKKFLQGLIESGIFGI